MARRRSSSALPLSCGARRVPRRRPTCMRLTGIVTLTFWRLEARFVTRTRAVRFRLCARGRSGSNSRVSNNCAAWAAVTLPVSTMYRMWLRSSVELAMELPFHQAHRIFDADLFRGKAVENSTPVGAAVILGCAAQRSHYLVQAAARGV